jgi:hypothetical protein
MRPLPDINDEAAMLERGRKSALWSARNEACEVLRDACTACQSADIGDVSKPAADAAKAAQRLIEVATLWAEL